MSVWLFAPFACEDFFQGMTAKEMKACSALNSIYHVTVDQHQALFIPAGFYVAEQILTSDSWGLQWSFLFATALFEKYVSGVKLSRELGKQDTKIIEDVMKIAIG